MAKRIIGTTPKQDGYRMPAEFEPQQGVWMLWPERNDNWRDGGKPAQKAFADVAKAIAKFEKVTVGASVRQYQNARAKLPENIRVVELERDDAWVRDCGPTFLVNDVGMGDPFFCKYLCPQGVLEGAIPLSLANAGIRAALGKLFTWKFSILLSVIVLSVLFYRPFCKWLCPLGAFYALFNRVSLFQMKVDKSKCVSCGKCARACKMDVDVTKTPNHTECIRCGMCIRACPTNAVCFRYGFGDGKEKENAATLRENNNKA